MTKILNQGLKNLVEILSVQEIPFNCSINFRGWLSIVTLHGLKIAIE